jgi:hypothetical protein
MSKKNATQGHVTHPPRGLPKTGRVNYTAMEDIPKGEQVLTDTFSLNRHPIIILFDSCVTHDFISRVCTQKHQLDIQHSDSPYMISTPGGRTAIKHIVRKTILDLGGRCLRCA